MISELEVNIINTEYNFKAKVFGDKIFIESKTDSWIVTEVRDGYLLNHLHNSYKSGKHRTHRHMNKKEQKQRVYKDLEFLFNSIDTHDIFVTNGRTIK